MAQLISSPSDSDRAYICDECISVCASILSNEKAEAGVPIITHPSAAINPLLQHPLASPLMDAIENWILQEAIQNRETAALAFSDVRALAYQIVTAEAG